MQSTRQLLLQLIEEAVLNEVDLLRRQGVPDIVARAGAKATVYGALSGYARAYQAYVEELASTGLQRTFSTVAERTLTEATTERARLHVERLRRAGALN